MRTKHCIRCTALAFALAFAIVPARAQKEVGISTTGQPTRWELRARPIQILGFLNARFGTTIAEVRTAIGTDFPGALASAREETIGAGQRTLTITPPTPADDPAGDAQRTVSYVFGSASQRLIAVNASWLIDGNPTAQQRSRLLALGTAFTAEVAGYQWPMLATARGHVIAPNVVILLAGQDEQGAGIEIRVDGVALDVLQPDADGVKRPPLHQPAPQGPARLRLALVGNAERPDVPTVPPGRF